MWIVIQIAKSIESAAETQKILNDEGVLVKLRKVYKDIPPEQNYFEVRVLTSEAEEAREIILEKLT